MCTMVLFRLNLLFCFLFSSELLTERTEKDFVYNLLTENAAGHVF